MNKTKIFILLLVCAVVFGAGLGFYSVSKDKKENQQAVTIVEPSYEKMTSANNEMLNVDPVYYATLTSVGDIMMHQWQITRGYNAATDTFDYAEAFTYIKDYLINSDYTVGNLETTFAGRNNGASTDIYGYACYPRFNAPEVLASNLKDLGFDLLSTANNHSLDSYEEGVYSTLEYLDSNEILHTGTARTVEEQEELTIVDINGIKFGFCSYTYDTNGIPVPSDAKYCVNVLDWYDQEKINDLCQKVRDLRAAGAEVVVPIVHFGTEYMEMPDKSQYKVVDQLFAAGADIILGGHPHVVEPMEFRQVTTEDGTEKTGIVIYSMGNFISSQKYENGIMKDIGTIIDIDFAKEDGVVRVEAVRLAPTYVYWTNDVIGVVPVVEAYENPSKYPFLSSYDMSRITDSYTKTIETLMKLSDCTYTIENYEYNINLSYAAEN